MANTSEVYEPLLLHHREKPVQKYIELSKRVWIESTKLWKIVGPAICGRLAGSTMFVITQACAGHLGDLELGAISVASNVIVGLDVGLLLGMASALETLGGQAFGAKKYYMLGIYLQRSWLVLLISCILLLPLYLFAPSVLQFLGQPKELAELSGTAAMWMLPLHFAFALQMPLQRFLQSQMRNKVVAIAGVVALAVHCLVSYMLVSKLELGLIGAVVTLDLSWWLIVFVQLGYTVGGGCPLTWSGFSWDAFSNLWDYAKLSVSSGVMLCLDNWYYRILILMTGLLKDSAIVLDALSICMSINSWEMSIPLAFFAGTGVRVANELGAGNGEGAKFATKVAVGQSFSVGVLFCVVIMLLRSKVGWLFSSSEPVIEAVGNLSILLAFSIVFSSVQPVLSGVAVGCGWQHWVAKVNFCCYYLVGLPVGLLIGWAFDYGVKGIWAGMIFGGTVLQLLAVAMIAVRCNWVKEAERAAEHVHKWEGDEKRHDINF